jgi:predicted amidohydrolase
MITDPMGRILAQAKESDEIVLADLDEGLLAKSRAAIPVSAQRRFDVYPDIGRLFCAFEK